MKNFGKIFFGIGILGILLGFISFWVIDSWVIFYVAVLMFIVGSIGTTFFSKDLKACLIKILDIL